MKAHRQSHAHNIFIFFKSMLMGHTQVISDSPRQLGLRVNWCMLGGLIEKCTHMPTFSNSFLKKDKPNKKENSSLMFVNSPQIFF